MHLARLTSLPIWPRICTNAKVSLDPTPARKLSLYWWAEWIWEISATLLVCTALRAQIWQVPWPTVGFAVLRKHLHFATVIVISWRFNNTTSTELKTRADLRWFDKGMTLGVKLSSLRVMAIYFIFLFLATIAVSDWHLIVPNWEWLCIVIIHRYGTGCCDDPFDSPSPELSRQETLLL